MLKSVAALVLLSGMTLAAAARLTGQAPAPAQTPATQTPPAQTPPPQTPPPPAPGGRGAGQGRGGGGGFAASYPQRPPGDPEMIERGKAMWDGNCAFCHGRDARGGDQGPSLLRSQLVLNDQNGELMAPVVQNGRLDRGMPKFNLTNAQVADIAAFVHSFRVGGYDISRERPTNILVGDAAAGDAAFKARCAACHSTTGDLKSIGTRFADPKELQQTWLMPSVGGRGGGSSGQNPLWPTVTVTLPSGEKVQGRLGRVDEFLVTLIQDDGTPRSFRRSGDTPKVEIKDPLQPHKDLLAKYTDKEIHDITAYLATVK